VRPAATVGDLEPAYSLFTSPLPGAPQLDIVVGKLRASSTEKALRHVLAHAETLGARTRLFSGPHGHILWWHWQLWFVLAMLSLAVLEESRGWFERLPEAPAWVYASAIAVFLFCLELIGFSGHAVPFVYFQF